MVFRDAVPPMGERAAAPRGPIGTSSRSGPHRACRLCLSAGCPPSSARRTVSGFSTRVVPDNRSTRHHRRGRTSRAAVRFTSGAAPGPPHVQPPRPARPFVARSSVMRGAVDQGHLVLHLQGPPAAVLRPPGPPFPPAAAEDGTAGRKGTALRYRGTQQMDFARGVADLAVCHRRCACSRGCRPATASTSTSSSWL